MSSEGNGWQYDSVAAPTGNRLGIAFSGGGIRSAAFCLGAYQKLQERGVYEKATFVSAVSGGSYIASAIEVTAALSDAGTIDDNAVWTAGSPEESYLRNHLEYLAPGVQGKAWLALNWFFGFAVIVTCASSLSFIAGRLYGLAILGIENSLEGFTPQHWLLEILSLACAVLLLLLSTATLGLRRATGIVRRTTAQHAMRALRSISTVGVLLAAFVVLAGCIGPALVYWLERLLRAAGPPSIASSAGEAIWPRLLIGACTQILFVLCGVAGIRLLTRGRALRISASLAWLSTLGILVVPGLMAAEGVAVRGTDWSHDAISILIAAGLYLLLGFLLPVQWYSMHEYYREQLSAVFTLVRKRNTSSGAVSACAIPYGTPVEFSSMASSSSPGASRPRPNLIICGAVASELGRVPTRAWAASLTFEAASCKIPSTTTAYPTTALERSVGEGGAQLTLPAIVAISGAALSPLMGRYTVPALRALMALLNVRLGVWLPNYSRAMSDKGYSWLKARRRRTPGVSFVLREALGLVRGRDRFVHVADGGHWENLGLVELLRRRATHIMVFDASAPSRDSRADLARATALARAELGVELNIHAEDVIENDEGFAVKPFAIGEIVYPDGRRGVLYYCRSCLWQDAPADLAVFRTLDTKFPHHPTSNQIFTGDQFEAYRVLGFSVAGAAVDASNLLTMDFRTEKSVMSNLASSPKLVR